MQQLIDIIPTEDDSNAITPASWYATNTLRKMTSLSCQKLYRKRK
jgi:hypothetical protein